MSNTFISLYNGKGFVGLEDSMPSYKNNKTLDFAIPQMARVSYGKLLSNVVEKKGEEKKGSNDESLINYLIEHHHTSPLEGIKFKFVIQAPIYVVRHIVRHRTANINEYSMRYSEAIDEFYFPELRLQDTVNKQGSIISGDIDKIVIDRYQKAKEKSVSLLEDYNFLIKNGVAKEVARTILPTAEMTKLYYCMDLHNLFKFFKLRMDSHAQLETQELAIGMYQLIKPFVPIACQAFETFWLNSITFSSEEIKIIKEGMDEDIREVSERIIKNNINLNKRQTKSMIDKIKKIKGDKKDEKNKKDKKDD